MSLSRPSHKTVFDELYAYLCRFMPLTIAEFGIIRQYAEIREFDKKVKVIGVGEMENYLNIVARGLVRKYLPVKNKELVVQLATEMHFINAELSFHYRILSRSVVETIEPTVFISISYDNLQQLFERLPKAERLGRLMISDLFVRTDQHYFDQLRWSTRERFLEYVQNHPHMLQRVPQKFIASYLNIKPETFSRLKHLVARKNKTGQ